MKDSLIPLALVLGVVGLVGYSAYKSGQPGGPSPIVAPTPTPPAFSGYVVVCTQPACPPCDVLKANIKPIQGIDIRYADVSTRAGRKQYPVKATPTTIRFLTSGKEIDRREGVMSAADFVAWVNSGPTSTPVRELTEGEIE